MDKGGEHPQFLGVRMYEHERAMLEQLAYKERRSLAAMIRELIVRASQRRLVHAGADDERD